jgi:16S rRNA (guanine527-N7)-methyltransferase
MTRLPTEMSAAEFAALSNVSRETLDRLELYVTLLHKWQKAINLVGADSLTDVWRRHILDSAQLAEYIPKSAQIITDFGSGAGFPGLALSIILDRPVHLIESAGKKAAFLREVARLTKAPAVVHNDRIEKVVPWRSDVVTARALAPLGQLMTLSEPFLGDAGNNATCVFLKGGRTEEELTEANKSWTMAVERFPSVSDPTGTILRIRDIRRDTGCD